MDSAGLLIRLIAWLYDLLLVGVPLCVFSVTLFGMSRIAVYVFFIFFLVYATITPAVSGGYTLGKKILRIRILVHQKNQWFAMMMRHIVTVCLYVLSCGLLLIVSIMMMEVREDRCSLHDLFANTSVIQE